MDDPRLGNRVGIGRGSEVFEWGGDAVIKLLSEGSPERIEFEASAQRAAWDAGLRVPRVREVLMVGSLHGLVMDRIAGADGLTEAQAHPWRLWSIGRNLGRLHHQLNSVSAPAILPRITDMIRDSLDSTRIPEAARGRVRELFATLPEGDSLCHFDFHPGNVIESPDGPVIIDLASACIGEATADYARTLMLFDVGTPAGDLSLKERALIKFGRGAMLAAYRSGYKAAGPLDEGLARRWLPVIVALRLAEDLPEERVALLRLLSRSLREAEQLE